ncbi:helix-turn-helix transcriptional regulator [Halalkalibacter akibai]|uniref:HTH cro/C1-type domain-containing protein n=1 Tax=Halalkalibacter akibai (strain ATCC 43226 / DSM 21942 / CIP 109018 / JCM 9157 / 1139) TaxID=1236973 RepID=W4QXK9_HALA3|nr:helix-turn-helix transcriptional regulator [Halalkalibacter akibai]GAE36642.1 hypothetical protein JCM9157_3843 [Halalkalibacter akibai JCM 9157]
MDKRNLRFMDVRQKLGLTQVEVAKNVGLSQSMIAHIEAGNKEPSKLYKLRIASLFSVSVEWLFYEQLYEGGVSYESKNSERLSNHS